MTTETTESELSPEERVLQLEKELRDLKAGVVKIARREAKTHNWCSVVDRALEEMGLGPKWQTVTVEATVPLSITLDIDTNLANTIDPESIQQALQRQLSSLPREGEGLSAARFRRGHGVTVGVPTVTQTSVVVAPAPSPGDRVAPGGYLIGFTSVEGRVAHYVPESYMRRTDRWTRGSAICGAEPNGRWQESSARDTGGVCARCEERSARR